MGENEDTNGMVSLINGKPNPDFFNHINYQKETLRKQLEVMKSTTVRQLPRFQSDSKPTTSTITTAS